MADVKAPSEVGRGTHQKPHETRRQPPSVGGPSEYKQPVEESRALPGPQGPSREAGDAKRDRRDAGR
jgi:hypothetical protein